MEQGKATAAVEDVLQWLGGLEVGEGLAHEGMTVFAVRPGANGDGAASLEYGTLAEGIAEGWLRVSERPSASVPELVLVNRGQMMALILDGEEIVGGKQNRIVNASFLVGAGSEVLLPVSCVEHGRWHDVSPVFAAGEASPHSLKREKYQQVNASLRSTGRAEADQGAIWDHLARREVEFGQHSATGAMNEIYHSRDEVLAGFERLLPYQEGAIGLVAALNGKLAGADLFDQPRTARVVWGKLVRSYALDALGKEPGAPVVKDRAAKLLARFKGARGEVYPSLALGEDVRLQGDGAVGSALVHQGTPVHVSLFRTYRNGASASGRMASASARRNLRRDLLIR